MNVKNEMPTGSVTETIRGAMSSPSRSTTFVAELRKKPVYLK
jgi:hypothetical protein